MASRDESREGPPPGEGPSADPPSGPGRGEPVTITVARRVAPGRERDFEAWAEGILAEARRFSGFLGGGVLRPGEAGREWHIVYRFADSAAQGRWEASPERARWLAAADGFADERRVQRVTGLETWFALPGRTAPAPPRWKMALVTFTAVFPLALLFNVAVFPLLEGVWLPLRVAALSVTLVGLMTWVAMPNLTRLFAGWLYPRRADEAPAPEE